MQHSRPGLAITRYKVKRCRLLLAPAAGLALLVAGLVLAAGASPADGPARIMPNLWITDGPVYALAPAGNLLYIGGRFTYVGPANGSGIPLDAGSGAPLPAFPRVNGTVHIVVPDGSGGWYIGGEFSQVGDLPLDHLAHILPSYAADPGWKPAPNDTVTALVVSGSTVYAGGDFTHIGGQTRNHVAALNGATGRATAWNPDSNSGIGGSNYAMSTLVVSGSTVYAAGNFTHIGRQDRDFIAALDATSGDATAWNPDADLFVYTLAVSGSTVYVGGNFTHIGGQDRSRIAALDAATGGATDWNPNASGSYLGVYTLAVSGSTVYAGGDFDYIGGQSRNNLAALDAATGNATAWNPDATGVPVASVNTLAVSGSTVYAGGDFTRIGAQPRNFVAALDAATGEATPWNPLAAGDLGVSVYTLAASGSTVYAGGSFISIGGQSRNNLAALDATTGEATAWNPGTSGGYASTVHTLAVSGSMVYAGGAFTSAGGQTRNYIAALDAGTGEATAWDPNANAEVSAMVMSGGIIYAGGEFTNIGGKDRGRIAALDAATGDATAWNPDANGDIHSLVVSESTVYAGGAFTSAGGQTRDYIAALDAGTGNATAWNPGTGGSYATTVHTLAVSGSTVYAGGAFTSAGGQIRNYLAALDAATGAPTAWNPDADGWVHTLAVSGSTVYAGGSFTRIGGQNRSNLAALDAATGDATAWNPGATGVPGVDVDTLVVGGSTVYAGGDFTRIGGQPRFFLAGFIPPLNTFLPVILKKK